MFPKCFNQYYWSWAATLKKNNKHGVIIIGHGRGNKMGQFHLRVHVVKSETWLAKFLLTENVNPRMELSRLTSLTITDYFYAPATIGRGALTPVRLSHLVCIVCLANSYSFFELDLLYFVDYLLVHWRCAYFDFEQFFTKLCIYELGHWNLLTCKQRFLLDAE